MSDSERIIKVLEFSGLKATKFAEYVGINTVQTIYDIKKGKHGISKEVADKIQAKYLNINLEWLLTGKGNMLNDEDYCVSQDDIMRVPHLPLDAIGGSLNDFVTSVKRFDCEQVVCPVEGADFSITVSGDSMAPEYPNGSRIFIKRIKESAFIDWGKVYVLDTCNGVVVKRLVPSEKDTDKYVRCLSINQDPIYAPFEVAWEDIYGVYRVLLCMSVK